MQQLGKLLRAAAGAVDARDLMFAAGLVLLTVGLLRVDLTATLLIDGLILLYVALPRK